jgi:membrane fusion protein (multidrug efflux system)
MIRMKMKLLSTLAVLVLIGQGCQPSSEKPSSETPAPVAVELVKPRRGAITRSITLPGEIRAYQQATLYAKVTGYLKNISVDKGDAVTNGALLAEIEVPELLADRARFRAEVEVAQTDFNRLNYSNKKAPDLVTAQSVDDARGKLDIAKATRDRTETLLGFTKITAPFSGIVTRRFADPGAFIPAATAGSTPQSAAIVTLADFNTVRVQVAVPEAEASHVEAGEPVTLNVEGLPGKNFEGTITRFSYALDDASKTMLAEIEMPNPKLELRPGMYASVKIGIEKKDGAMLIPVGALFTEKVGPSVFTLADGKAKKIPVKTGFNNGTNVEIVSGISPEEPVILLGKQTLSNGQPVTTK